MRQLQSGTTLACMHQSMHTHTQRCTHHLPFAFFMSPHFCSSILCSRLPVIPVKISLSLSGSFTFLAVSLLSLLYGIFLAREPDAPVRLLWHKCARSPSHSDRCLSNLVRIGVIQYGTGLIWWLCYGATLYTQSMKNQDCVAVAYFL